MPLGPRRLPLALLLVAGVAQPADAAVWKRTRPDGTEEFTNVRPSGKSWRVVESAGRAARPAAAAPRIASSSGGGGGAVWTRQNADGTVEFTNLQPVGARWKVLFRSGPGKAAALRGSSDLYRRATPRAGASRATTSTSAISRRSTASPRAWSTPW
jgi:hypothetical protein